MHKLEIHHSIFVSCANFTANYLAHIIINITLSSNVIGLNDYVFSTELASYLAIGQFVIAQSVIGQLGKPITIKAVF